MEQSRLGKKKSKFIFILGGASSGKSEFALKQCGATKPRVFVATGQPLDSEMTKRIHSHRRSRGSGWKTLEIPVNVAEWLRREGPHYPVVVVDCMTLWLSNLQREGLRTRQILSRIKDFPRAVRHVPGLVVAVSNELGLGLVPLDSPSRRFRDLSGQVNQLIAAAADEVYWVVSGIPIRLK
jgi:adenosylcobinamide kinase/adenosylcobinamide-phosphate guanylyltransferase